MIVNQYKVAILFYMLIVIQVQPELNQDHHYRPYYKHSHDHQHAHHLKHQMEHNHDHHHKHAHAHDHDHHRRSQIRKSSRIYNGVRAPFGQAKFMAVIMAEIRGGTRMTHCSAVIITEDMLLTAAHCLYGVSIADVWAIMRVLPNVVPMRIYRNNPDTNHPLIKRITRYWIHPRYHPNTTDMVYDIAIIRIGPDPWPLGEHIETALMPVRVKDLDWRVIKAYGYGFEAGPRMAQYLNELNFRYTCRRRFFHGNLPYDTQVVFCVSNWVRGQSLDPSGYSNAAHGDSGGGIFVLGTVERSDWSTNRIHERTGLILTGIMCMGSNYTLAIADLNRPYGVWAVNVTYMMPWINSIVRVDFETYRSSMPTSGRIG